MQEFCGRHWIVAWNSIHSTCIPRGVESCCSRLITHDVVYFVCNSQTACTEITLLHFRSSSVIRFNENLKCLLHSSSWLLNDVVSADRGDSSSQNLCYLSGSRSEELQPRLNACISSFCFASTLCTPEFGGHHFCLLVLINLG